MQKKHKYKYTNTQIQHMTKCLKDPTCGILFLKRGLFKDIKNHIQLLSVLEIHDIYKIYDIYEIHDICDIYDIYDSVCLLLVSFCQSVCSTYYVPPEFLRSFLKMLSCELYEWDGRDDLYRI